MGVEGAHSEQDRDWALDLPSESPPSGGRGGVSSQEAKGLCLAAPNPAPGRVKLWVMFTGQKGFSRKS